MHPRGPACVYLVTVVGVVASATGPVGVAHAQDWLGRLSGPHWADQLTSADADVRMEAAARLGGSGEASAAVEALTAALTTESNPGVRRAMVAALARRGAPEVVEPLLAAFQNPSHPDRGSVARVLVRLQSPEAVAALVDVLRQDDIRPAVIEALVEVGPAAVAPLSVAAAEPATRLWASEALGKIGDPRATTLLIGQLAEADEAVRVVALDALRGIGDPRAGPAVAQQLEHPSLEVQLAAARCLGAVGEQSHAALLVERLDHEDLAMRRAALRSLVNLAPTQAAGHMEALVSVSAEPLAPLAIELALQSTHPRMVPLLFGLVREGTRAAEALSALAEVSGGRGVSVLVREAAEGEHRFDAQRALAVGLRTWHEELSSADVSRGVGLLRHVETENATRAMILRAVARDSSVRPSIIRGLESSEAPQRAIAAAAAEALGDPALAEPLAAAIARERDPEAFRRQAMAALRLSVVLPISSFGRWLETRATIPEASWLAARSLADATPEVRRALRRRFREQTRDADPRVRTGALRALAIAADHQAYRAVLQRLDDPAREVRHAACWTLTVLSVSEAVPALWEHYRVETDPMISAALLDAIASPRQRRLHTAAQGEGTLRVRIAAVEAVDQADRVTVDVVRPDAAWIRVRTLGRGELILVDLPEGVADVRVRLE